MHAPTEEIARQVAQTAEECRRDLAIVWLGEELPNWYRRCPIKVKVGQIGAGGATTFTFEGGEVFGWNMNVQGSLERILDSVIPHEVSHTIFASHFRRPLPRWADEGAATLVEHESERLRQTKLLDQILRTSRRIPLQRLLEITEYPPDMHDVLTLYAEGYSLADFLVRQKGEQGRAIYMEFLNDAHQHNWEYAFQKNYGFQAIRDVEAVWHEWIIAGSPDFPSSEGTQLASAEPPQSPEPARITPANKSGTQLIAATTQPANPAEELQPLPAIQRPLRRRLAGSQLEAPEPSVTAMPARNADVDLGESAPSAKPLVTGVSIPLELSSGERPLGPFSNEESTRREPRPQPIAPVSPSLRSVNAGRDAFQR